MSGQNNETIVLHLIVVGFHHKKGCLVEYCYPPFDTNAGTDDNTGVDNHSTPSDVTSGDIEDNSAKTSATDTTTPAEPLVGDQRPQPPVDTIVLPEIWKTLPSLALPDGSHNHERDGIYFHLPDLLDHNRTVFGVSCYRQINANKLKAKTSDVTRGTVQKSVVVLSRLPLYGLIEAKLEMITHAYFRELDFSKVSLLEETYHNLNAQLSPQLMTSPELYVGLATRQLVVDFHHKILVLFKLLLLERKVLFYKSPVKPLCVSILSLCSLMPGLIRRGLSHCSVSVHTKHSRQYSADVELSPLKETDEFFVLGAGNQRSTADTTACDGVDGDSGDSADPFVDNTAADTVDKACAPTPTDTTLITESHKIVTKDESDDDLLYERDEVLSARSSNRSSNRSSTKSSTKSSPVKEHREVTAQRSQSVFYDTEPEPTTAGDEVAADGRTQSSTTTTTERIETPPILKLLDEDCGLPLEIFSCGAYLQPYLSLTYLDVLTDVRVRSCLVGATNFLFKQKKDIFDVIVELDAGKVDILDAELRKQLALTTEDLRFAEYLTKTVLTDGENGDIFVDGTGWEGSDEWVRYQFKVYLLHLLRSSEMDENSKDYQSFNTHFVNAWRTTHNYKMWSSVSHPSVFEVTCGHPFGGQLSISDMKLKISQYVLS
ncbi:unnamed protein product [Medioppia subpectinata]|uniref:UDENN domain-containing protein n=1 Tax=Medioppia subpectinata TaxID=1979941 RepID=A0A7R9QCC0_9ACAR|nr:unnamed protein product [Medioppia subpectinata]CAG2117847.1 unnamed protein product [Medioppia subpectinata]